MMSNFFSRSGVPQVGGSATQTQRAARSAALLIDFDNVTLGVHSDLGRELKSLINSEIFRGKIAVRRAYADWRRFPNYVVPLTEASIDLIFAPAYGSSKKNTTDLRMSADAIELAFTRPEIDTFILLTGDSDFSSTVMKLKEYGKYVIGVGMRESSSDLIIQNCDEYFSYHALTGLTRSTAGEGMREDPWELVVRAAQKMASTGDAMRTDRLKQVMLSLDPGFNEKEIGYSKFSRFVAEADKKGLLKLNKLPDGQYEISVDGGTRAAAPASEAREPRERRDRDARHRRGDRGDRDRGRRREPVEAEARPEPQIEAETVTAAPETVNVPPEPIAVPDEETPVAPAAEAAPAVPAAPADAAAAAAPPGMELALALLQRAVRALAPQPSAAVRDGDVKRRMLDIDPSFDEAELGYSKFSRFLRQAHDLEAIDLERLEGGQYEVKLGSRRFEALAEAPAPGEAAAPRAGRAAERTAAPPAATPLRGRTRSRKPHVDAGAPPPLLPGQVIRTAASADAAAIPGAEQAPVDAPEAQAAPAETESAEAQPAAEAAEPAAEAAPSNSAEAPVVRAVAPAAEAATARRRDRRGRRGAPLADAPPAPLPGQVVGRPTGERLAESPAEAEAPVAAEVAPEAPEAEIAEAVQPGEESPRKRRRGGRGRKRGAEATAAAGAPDGEPAEPEAAEAFAATEAPAAFSAEAFNLPTDRDKIENYLTKSYKGVGKKTVEPLLDAFGEDIFRVFTEEPDRVREILGDKRAATVLDQWTADYERRAADAVPAEESPEVEPAAASDPEAEAAEEPSAAAEAPATRARRRGGRGRKRNDEDKPAEAGAADEEPGAPAPAEGSAPDEAAAEVEAPARKTRSRGGRGRNDRGKKKQPTST